MLCGKGKSPVSVDILVVGYFLLGPFSPLFILFLPLLKVLIVNFVFSADRNVDLSKADCNFQ